MFNLFFTKFKKYKFIVFTIVSNVVFISLLNFIANKECEFNFLIKLNSIEDFQNIIFIKEIYLN